MTGTKVPRSVFHKTFLIIIAFLVGIVFLIGILIFSIILSFEFGPDPIKSFQYFRTMDQSLATENWNIHKDNQTGLSFAIPPVFSDIKPVSLTRPSVLSTCIGGRTNLTRVFGISFCKNPTEEYISNILNDERYAASKQMRINDKNYTVAGLSNNWKIGRYWISEDHKILVELLLPYASETSTWRQTRLEKIYTRMILSLTID